MKVHGAAQGGPNRTVPDQAMESGKVDARKSVIRSVAHNPLFVGLLPGCQSSAVAASATSKDAARERHQVKEALIKFSAAGYLAG
ncbi:MAG: hypothetical protein ACO1TE_28280 [Prosthecobacter sp.]